MFLIQLTDDGRLSPGLRNLTIKLFSKEVVETIVKADKSFKDNLFDSIISI